MANIKILVGGKCQDCGHSQQTHEDNKGCVHPIPEIGEVSEPCGCEKIGSY